MSARPNQCRADILHVGIRRFDQAGQRVGLAVGAEQDGIAQPAHSRLRQAAVGGHHARQFVGGVAAQRLLDGLHVAAGQRNVARVGNLDLIQQLHALGVQCRLLHVGHLQACRLVGLDGQLARVRLLGDAAHQDWLFHATDSLWV